MTIFVTIAICLCTLGSALALQAMSFHREKRRDAAL